MNKTQNGLTLIVVGVAMNIVGRLIGPAIRANPNIITASIFAIWMLASVVFVLFGLFRLIAGWIAKGRARKVE